MMKDLKRFGERDFMDAEWKDRLPALPMNEEGFKDLERAGVNILFL